MVRAYTVSYTHLDVYKRQVFLKEREMDRLLDDVPFKEDFTGCRDSLKVMKRILRMAGLPDDRDSENLEFLALRKYTPEQRIRIVEQAIYLSLIHISTFCLTMARS